MTANRPRKSHYVPKFYLAGFAASGRVDGDLHVFDLETGGEWPSTPGKSATERDFYVVDLGPGQDPDMIEKILGGLETEFSRVVRDIATNMQLPHGEDYNWFLNFVASMTVRTPHARQAVTGAIDRVTKADLRRQLATREGWEEFRRGCAALGHKIADDEYGGYKEFAGSERYSADFDQTSHVRVMTKELMDALLEGLAERHWSLGVAMDDAPDFICSDAPVAMWPVQGVDLSKPITFTSPGTVMSMPITRRLVAIGRYERRSPVQVVIPDGVSLFNTWTLSKARRVYASMPEFRFRRLDGQAGRKADLAEMIRRRAGG